MSFQRYFLVLFLVLSTFGDEHNHKYSDGEEILLWVNKVGPYRNPQEAYKYYSLPYCKPSTKVETRWEGLGEALQGYELIQSDMKIFYKKDIPDTILCEPKLSVDEVEKFKVAVRNQYWYQLFLDDLPIWGMVGEVVNDNGEEKLYLYTHKKFSMAWNDERVIEVNLTSENPVPLEKGVSVSFTYSVTWIKTDVPYDERFAKYLDDNFFEHQIHWFSIFNSFMMVIFLAGLVSMILMRTLKRDYARYSRDDEDDSADVGDDSGWKQIHADVFRPPPHLILFASLVGTGHQLVILIFMVIAISFLGTFYEDRGTTVTAFIVCYAFTSFIAGYSSGGYYARNEGKNWIKCMIITAIIFPVTCFCIAIYLDFIAMAYESLASIPFGTMVAVFFIWSLISFPLTVVGTIVGRNWNGTADNPCRVSPVPHNIPEKKWYLHPAVNIILGGILPFGSIFIEMYFMFTSFWHYKYYYVYGFLLMVYVILIVVTVCVTIVSTYFLLNSEDYRWQWVSFLSASSTAGYVFLYSIYYFFVKTKMNGFFQTSFYFGYTLMFCIGLGLMCGALGFIGTSIFVKRIYQNVKID